MPSQSFANCGKKKCTCYHHLFDGVDGADGANARLIQELVWLVYIIKSMIRWADSLKSFRYLPKDFLQTYRTMCTGYIIYKTLQEQETFWGRKMQWRQHIERTIDSLKATGTQCVLVMISDKSDSKCQAFLRYCLTAQVARQHGRFPLSKEETAHRYGLTETQLEKAIADYNINIRFPEFVPTANGHFPVKITAV